VVLALAAVGTLWLAGRQGSAPTLMERPPVDATTSAHGAGESAST
jgi:hypothetical protein